MSDWKLSYRGVEVPDDLFDADPDPYEEALGIWQRAVDAVLDAVDSRPEGLDLTARDPEPEDMPKYDYYTTSFWDAVWRFRVGNPAGEITDASSPGWITSAASRETMERNVELYGYKEVKFSDLPEWARKSR